MEIYKVMTGKEFIIFNWIAEKHLLDKKPPKILWDYETFTLPGRADKTKMTK